SDRVILLIGNHDYQYFDLTSGEQYTGFQDKYAFDFNIALRENMDLLQLCYTENNTIFSHAGISKGFLVNKGIIEKEEKFEGFDYQDLVVKLNDLMKYKPNEFSFTLNMLFDDKGDDIIQSPIWIRPYSLALSSIPIRQVVGHTRVDLITNISDRIYLIDALKNR